MMIKNIKRALTCSSPNIFSIFSKGFINTYSYKHVIGKTTQREFLSEILYKITFRTNRYLDLVKIDRFLIIA